MSFYWDPKFIKHLDINNIHYVCEVGARYGDESIKLSNTFENGIIYSFECNPNTIDICKSKLKNNNRIKFYDIGLGDKEEQKPFYSYVKNNHDGPSSFFKRFDYNETQVCSGYINIKRLSTFVEEEKIPYLDLLCMDVQGYELNILKGCNSFLQKIKYIIMEQPKEIINTRYLTHKSHSNYIGAPSHNTIKEFMDYNNFIEIERIRENDIEDNVMYKNKYL